ncbi:MAG: hypothetical protein QOJ99_458 [Bryobacterales bacterium]|jgi:mono/diheme cytochrome c family protein|nr:hypothetical protein [Bryobacterales bacterium]
MQRNLKFFLSAFSLGLLVAAGGAGLSSADEGRGDGKASGSAIEGRRVFLANNCYGCHGGRVGGGMCPEFRSTKPDIDAIEEAVRKGTETGMPRFPNLTRVDTQNLAAYFQSLRTSAEPTFTHWWEPMPSQ